MTKDPQATPVKCVIASPPRYSATSDRWPCIFRGWVATERLIPAVKRMWETERPDERPKWGDLTNTFRSEHCYRVNPYGSDSCPFRDEDCGLAFYVAVEQSVRKNNPYGYFRAVARSTGAARSDLGAELRARMRTDGTHPKPVGGTLPTGPRPRHEDRLRDEPESPFLRGVASGEPLRGVRRVATGPIPLGDVLGSFDFRSHPRPGGDSDEDEGEGR